MGTISKKTAYDIKEASNQGLTPTARKHYAEDAQAAVKSDGAAMCGGPKMESNSQERKNLMSDNPVAKKASGPAMKGGSWMTKHCNS